MYKEDLTLNNLQWLICHKTQPNQTKPGSNGNEGVVHIRQSSTDWSPAIRWFCVISKTLISKRCRDAVCVFYSSS